jgi:hypothetical protein
MAQSFRFGVVLGAVVLVSCFAREREKQIQEVKRDEKVLSGVSTAINQVLHNAADCDAVRAALPEAKQRLSEAYGAVREPGSTETLKMLSAQLERVESACP